MTASFRGYCVDCDPLLPARKVSRPGPRCAAHHRARRKTASDRRYADHIQRTYGITIEDYEAIYAVQGGRCYICQRANGATKRLSVDHDHAAEPGWRSVRGLLCSPCNKILGHLRDNTESAGRVVSYLENPPARSVLAERRGL